MKKESTYKIIIILVTIILTYRLGVKPMLDGSSFKNSNDWAKGLPKGADNSYDLIVFGGEPEGLAASISSARIGARTLLISEDGGLGGVVTRSLWLDLEINTNKESKIISKGIMDELYKKLGPDFTIEKYLSVVNEMAASEKKLDLYFNARLDSVITESGAIVGIKVTNKDGERVFIGKRFIDASRDGKLLLKCGVPHFEGSGDLNMKNSFQPVRLNFEIDGVSASDVNKIINSDNSTSFFAKIGKFTPEYLSTRIVEFKVYRRDSTGVIVEGIEVSGVKTTDAGKVKSAYSLAVKDARNFAAFLKNNFSVFRGINFIKAADEFYIRESRHFAGEYRLTVNDILNNSDFRDKIAMGSYPVNASKFIQDGRSYIIGKPAQYGIPLRCIIPLNVTNLLMVGSKISYSSVAATSAGTISIGITTGEAAGVASAYSLVKNIVPADIIKQPDSGKIEEFERLLRRQGMYLPEFTMKDAYSGEWYGTALKKLRTLALIAGGTGNDYRTSDVASPRDLVTLLLNGIYRLHPARYSLELDSRVTPHANGGKLVREKAGEILCALYDVKVKSGSAYSKACELGYIDGHARAKLGKLHDEDSLTMDIIYYLAVYNIEKYTGRNIPD